MSRLFVLLMFLLIVTVTYFLQRFEQTASMAFPSREATASIPRTRGRLAKAGTARVWESIASPLICWENSIKSR